MKRRQSRRVRSEAEFLKLIDPAYLRELSEFDPAIAGAVAPATAFVRAMEGSTARAELAFRQREAVENWARQNVDETSRDVVDRMDCVGAKRPWREAACEYVWELSSTMLRVAYADCTPKDFESLARLVVDVYSEKVYEEKVSLYEQSLGTEGSKAAFQEYVRKRLDPRVRADCLEKWQKRAAAISIFSNTEPQLKGWNTVQCADAVVQMLLKVIEKQYTTIEDWARIHGIARTTLYEWKHLRLAGKTLRGKVSEEMNAEIEKAIESDAKELGLRPGPTRTDTDLSK
jgi:hypothetical protein